MEPTTLRKTPAKATGPALGVKKDLQLPKVPTIDFDEVRNVITQMTIDINRKESEIVRLGGDLAAERRRTEILESVLDKFLKPSWRAGEFEFVPDLLEPSSPAPARTVSPPLESVSEA